MKPKPKYSSELYRYLFDLDAQDPELLRHDFVANYRVKQYIAGDLLEVEIFPVWNTYLERRRAKAQATKENQARQNQKDARNRFIRIAHKNFMGGYHVSLTFDHCADDAEAYRAVTRYVRQLRKRSRAIGFPDIRYMYVIEYSETAERAHIHMLLADADRSAAEYLWPHGYANTKALTPNDHLLLEMTNYLQKGPRGKRRWNSSQNLEKVFPRTSDKRLSKRKVTQLVNDAVAEGRTIFEAMNPGYRLIEPIEPRYSQFVAGAYLHVRMRRVYSEPDSRTPKARAPAPTPAYACVRGPSVRPPGQKKE